MEGRGVFFYGRKKAGLGWVRPQLSATMKTSPAWQNVRTFAVAEPLVWSVYWACWIMEEVSGSDTTNLLPLSWGRTQAFGGVRPL